MLPVVTTLATATPEIMPNSPLPITAAFAGPPLRPPMADRDRFRKKSPPPEMAMSWPKITKVMMVVENTCAPAEKKPCEPR